MNPGDCGPAGRMSKAADGSDVQLSLSQRQDDGPIKCTICDQGFSRPEHLARHNQVHTRTRMIKCIHCEKTFSRKDSAKRHERLHGQRAGSDSPSLDRPLRRTCKCCTKSRIKCSGGTPCTQCVSKSLECIYLPRKRKQPRYSVTSQRPESLETMREDHRPRSGSLICHDELADETSTNKPDAPTNRVLTTWAAAEFDQPGMVSTDNAIHGTVLLNQEGWQGHLERDVVQDSSTIRINQWDTRPIGTNWLPFDNIPLSDLIVPSPDDNIPYASPSSRILPSGVIHEPEPELAGRRGSSERFLHVDGGVLQQSLVSSLINSMVGTWPNNYASLEAIGSLNTSGCQATRYADGVGFRESRAERSIRERRTSYADQTSTENELHEAPTWLSELSRRTQAAESAPTSSPAIPDSIFDDLVSRLWPLNGNSHLTGEYLLHQDTLLDNSAFQLLITSYFEQFHPINPFIDRSHLTIPMWGWSLCLATAAIGARYLGIKQVTLYGDQLCSILHELLLKEVDFGRNQESLPYIQARILAVVGLCQSSQPQLMRCGYNALAMVTTSCLQLRLLEEDDPNSLPPEPHSLEQAWVAWRFRETRRRTGLFIWFMESCFAFALEHPPITLSHTLKLKLPCQDEVWEADTPQAWFSAMSANKYLDKSSLAFLTEETTRQVAGQAAERLWSGGRATFEKSQFATIVIIHILLRRRWTASQYLKGVGPERSSTDNPASSNEYLGAVPEYISWRNHTCDCLDTLHWEAHSLSAKAEGFEGPVFLQLHLARLAILVPVHELLDHVTAAVRATRDHLLPHTLYRSLGLNRKSRRTILIWAHRDHYKARLAVVHAGAVLWHVRRYSSDSLIEPFTVFLAATVLWAFGQAYTVKRRQLQSNAEQSTGSQNQVSSSNVLPPGDQPDIPETSSGFEIGNRSTLPLGKRRMPRFIQLDRPVDDELVQYFIRSGDSMCLCLEGVDDLCSVNGPSQVLLEAASALSDGSRAWTLSETYAALLHDLASANS